jgi:hypothetical protein
MKRKARIRNWAMKGKQKGGFFPLLLAAMPALASALGTGAAGAAGAYGASKLLKKLGGGTRMAGGGNCGGALRRSGAGTRMAGSGTRRGRKKKK